MLHKIALRVAAGSTAATIVEATIAAAPLNSQVPDTRAAQGPGRGGRAPLMSPGEVVNMLDAYALVQAQETLQLSESQYATFVARLKKLHETRRRGQQERNRILRELRQLAGPQAPPQPDENALRTNLKALRDHDAKTAEESAKAYDAVDEILDLRQQARFRLFEERLEARKMDLLMRARQGAARGGGQ